MRIVELSATITSPPTYTIEVATASHCAHLDHSLCAKMKGLQGSIRAMVDDIGVQKPPREIRNELRKQGVVFDGAGQLKKQVEHYVKIERRQAKSKEMPTSLRGRYGGLVHYLNGRSKGALEEAGQFNEHVPYVLGQAVVVPEECRVTAAISTENLLLNAYRQARSGMPSFLAVDTTHRLIKEGHCCMPVGTVSLDQKFHIIGYGICSHKDIKAHEYVLHQIRSEVNRVVNDRAVKKQSV